MARSGAKRHSITLERQDASGTDEYGSPVIAWVAQSPDVWASIEAPSAKTMRNAGEVVLGGAVTGVDLLEVVIYPVEDLEPVKWRFRWNGRVYEIKTARLSNDMKDLTLLAMVGTSDGL
jgi:head-tail adaptor